MKNFNKKGNNIFPFSSIFNIIIKLKIINFIRYYFILKKIKYFIYILFLFE